MHLVGVMNGVLCVDISALCAIICYLLLPEEQLYVGLRHCHDVILYPVKEYIKMLHIFPVPTPTLNLNHQH
jgi:hypothetical protein